jgi:DNA polymerase-3 subunit epsilon
VIDTETTGLDLMNHELIEIAFAVGEFDNDGKLVLIEALSAVFPCDKNEAESINGISPILSQSGTIELFAVVKSLLSVDVFVAHNAKFDKGFCQKFFAECPDKEEYASLMSKPWVCTLSDYTIADKAGRRLTHMAADMGVFMSASKHRALIDVMLLFEVVSRLGHTAFVDAFERALWPEWRVKAEVPFEQKDLAKEAGFQWDAAKKMWLKDIKAKNEEALISMFKFAVKYRALHQVEPKANLAKIRPAEEIRRMQTVSFHASEEVLEDVAREHAMAGEG